MEKNKNAIFVGLHPGTVNSNLSKPFQSNVPEKKLFTPDQSVNYLIEVLLKLKDFSKGIEVLSELISKYPNNSKFQYFLAGFYMMISNNDEASFFLKNAYSISPSEIEVFYEVFPSSITNSLVKKTLQF